MNTENQNNNPVEGKTEGKEEKKPSGDPAGKTNDQPIITEMHEGVVITENEKAYEAALRRIFGIKDGEKLGSIDERITALEKKNADMIAQAKESIINAELRAVSGYDSKLLGKLIDRSKLTVDEHGNVQGLQDAIKAVETEFPAVKIPEKKEHRPFVPINPADSGADIGHKTMNDLIRGKR